MKIIVTANQKGGVAKTTTARALCYGLAARGFRVLACDADPQGSLTSFLGVDTLKRPTLLELLGLQVKNRCTFEEVKVNITKNLDLIPSDISLEEGALLMKGSTHFLASTLKPLATLYDYCVIDTSPSLSVLTGNALVAANEVIVPVKSEAASLLGVELLLQTIKDAKDRNPKIRVAGFLVTLYDKRRKSATEIVARLENIAAENDVCVYGSKIRASASGAAVSHGDFFAVPKLPICEDYNAFIEEYLSAQGGN